MSFRALVVATALVALTPALGVGVRPGLDLGVSVAARERDARSDAKEQVEFGIKVAQSGLWKEAAYRWEKATQIDPTYGAAWNTAPMPWPP